MRKLSDDLLVNLVKEGSDEAYNCLYQRYRLLIIKWINDKKASLVHFKIDLEDVYASMFDNFRNIIFNFEQNNGYFTLYLKKCCENLLRNVISQSMRNSRLALTSASSLDVNYGKDEKLSAYEIISTNYIINEMGANYDAKVTFQKIKDKLAELSALEKSIFKMWYNGYSYKEIAAKLNIKTKKVDNVIRSVRKKLTTC